jgi:hypothetical protein
LTVIAPGFGDVVQRKQIPPVGRNDKTRGWAFMPSLRDLVPFCMPYPRTEVLGYCLSPLRGLVVFSLRVLRLAPLRQAQGRLWAILSPLRGLVVFSVRVPRLAPLRQAQGRLWAAFLRRPSTSLRAGLRGFGLRELGFCGIPEMGILADLFWTEGSFVASSVG